MQISRLSTGLRAAILLLLALFSFACATAEGDAPAEQRSDDEGSHFFWTVLDEGATDGAAMYIYGSVHLADADVFPLPEFVYERFDASDRLILEVDVSSISPDAFFQAQGDMEYPAGQTLEDDLSEDEIQQLTETLSTLGIPFNMVKHLQPWVIETTIITALAEQEGIHAEYGIDMHFAERAEEQGIPMTGLETVDQQLKLLSSLALDTQAAELMRSIENYQDITAYTEELLEIWKTGDIEAMQAVIADAMLADAELSAYYERMFAERNRNWIDVLETELADGGTIFAVVGSGHLVGPDNLIELLRERGYRAIRR